jgi:NADP-dependent 3-hydroxy acid dehydrogenase YdfG
MSTKLAIISGASRGIGATIAKELSELGITVLLLARSAENLEQVAGYIQAEGGSAFSIPVNVTKEEEIEKVVQFVRQFDGEPTVLVHSAGLAKVGQLENFARNEWQQLIDTNLTGPFLLTQALIPLLPEKSQLIFVNSVAGKKVFPEWGAYSASKFGLRALADTFREELRPKGIRVTSIYPSSVNTTLHNDLPFDWDRQKMLKAKDIADAVIYCLKQPGNVLLSEIELENFSGTF